MKDYQELRDLADNMGLQVKELTKSLNGYPEPHDGWAAHGFDTFQDAKDFAEEVGGEVVEIHWYDGDHFANSKGLANKPFNRSAEDFGDDYCEFSNIEEEFEVLKERIAECNSLEDIQHLIKNFEKLSDALEAAEDGEVVVAYCGAYDDTIQANVMEYSYDTSNYAIAVTL